MPNDVTRLPFPRELVKLMDRGDVSFRGLAHETGISASYWNQVALGGKRPTIENVEAAARALGVPPTYFLEYRQHVACQRARALVRRYGLEAVLAALQRVGR